MSERTDKLLNVLLGARTRIVITGHDAPDVDSLFSCELMRRFLCRMGIVTRVAMMTPADEQSLRIAQAMGVDTAAMDAQIRSDDSLILLDHYQPQHGGDVLACIDHHPSDYLPQYPYIQVESCGACAMMVLSLMREAGAMVTQQDERLAVCALYLDTIALRSSKIAPDEIRWARETAARLGMDEAWLRREGLSLADMTLPAEKLAMAGLKEYLFGGRRVYSTYTQTDEMKREKLDEIFAYLRKELASRAGCMWVYLLHDPCAMRTTQYDVMPDGTVHTTQYGFLASRGKDVMTRVERRMMEENGDDRPV